MTQSKLYSALLKTQTEERARREADDRSGDAPLSREAEPLEGQALEVQPKKAGKRQAPPAEESDSVFVDDPLIETDYASPEADIPNWTSDFEEDRPGWPPAIYDSRVSLDMIYNPRPWTIEELKQRKIIYPGMSNRAILNAYREVRIKLRNLSGSRNFSVMLSSMSRRPGSVLTAYNLAASFAIDADSSALLVDCDPYQTDMQGLVSVPMAQGVTDYVSDWDMTVRDIIYPSGIDRLSVIPAGLLSSSAVELFSSVRMQELMEELVSRYPDRYIVINAPPFRVSTEARILERYAQHAVLAVPFGELTADEIMTAVESLDSGKFAGLIYQE